MTQTSGGAANTPSSTRSTKRRRWRVLAAVASGLALFASPLLVPALPVPEAEAQVESQYTLYPDLDPALDHLLLAKAQPDECFNTVGELVPGTPAEDGTCETGVPKVNEAYVWGLTRSADSLWFGTASNVLCGVLYGYLEVTEPVLDEDYVCERAVYDTSTEPDTLVRTDTRVPSIYEFDLGTKTLYDRTGGDLVAGWTPAAQTLLTKTSGFRSAGSVGDVVLLAGPATGGLAGINAFAIRTDTETPELLGAMNLPKYSNIRKWTVVDDVLYTGVGVRTSFGGGGRVLRWAGTLEEPIQFVEVGTTLSEIAELVEHEGRIFAASWPGGGFAAGVYMSPLIPEGGLTADHAAPGAWSMIWEASDYEPDPVTATTYGGGALASFDGYLYWGTMHVPGRAALQHEHVYGEPTTPEQGQETFLNTLRAIAVFRGRDFGTDDEVRQLVYGERNVDVWVPGTEPGTGAWESQPTGMGEPLWGPSGFGNVFNNYTWTMDVYDDDLYIGTMDWSYLALGSADLTDEFRELARRVGYSFGADLLRVESSSTPGVFESVDGFGNYTNYGFRTMLVDDALYLGSANPMNLMTDPLDGKPDGGWELLRGRTHRNLAFGPSEDTNVIGSPHTVTAVVSPPVEGLEMTFTATGANPGSTTVLTDATGTARWTYTGTTVGVDTITVTMDLVGRGWDEDELTSTATKTWVAPATTTTTSTTQPSVPSGGGGGIPVPPPVVVAARVEGNDRYRTAAATSARFFPDGADTVVVVTGETFPDALAAGPVAKVLEAPILLTQRHELPLASAAEILRLEPERIIVVGGTAAVGDEVIAELEALGVAVTRVAGVNRYQTSAVLSTRYFESGAARVYVATGDAFADALGAGAAAAHDGGPVLLTARDGMTEDVVAELGRLGPAAVVVVGGTAAVGEAVEDQIVQRLDDPSADVRRIAGVDRYRTSALLAAEAFPTPTGSVFVATGATFPDALAASALGHPILLVERTSVTPEVQVQVVRLGTDERFVLGGTSAVSTAVWDQLSGS